MTDQTRTERDVQIALSFLKQQPVIANSLVMKKTPDGFAVEHYYTGARSEQLPADAGARQIADAAVAAGLLVGDSGRIMLILGADDPEGMAQSIGVRFEHVAQVPDWNTAPVWANTFGYAKLEGEQGEWCYFAGTYPEGVDELIGRDGKALQYKSFSEPQG
jgi:hypothetical protein